MFLLSPQAKVFLAKDATDMRKSFRGLVAVTEAVLEEDPTSGHLFVFVNRRRDMMKILHWDGAGFWIWYRQLERGTFQLPAPETLDDASGIELTPSQLTLILDGIDLRSARQRLRYRELAETTK
jgi:transposase